MKRTSSMLFSTVVSMRVLGVLLALTAIPLGVWAAGPTWWTSRGVIATDGSGQPLPADDYAAANIGQLKQIASQAFAELQAKGPGGIGTSDAGIALQSLVNAWNSPTSATDDYAAVNLGQLKAVAKPFYDWLREIGYSSTYPWTNSTTAADDYAIANLGQVKNLFSFDVAYDSTGNGLPDWWSLKYFGSINVNAEADPTGDGLTNLQKYAGGFDPNDYYSGISASISATSPGNVSAELGSIVAEPMIVRVLGANGQPLVNAPVRFGISTGAGLISTTGLPDGFWGTSLTEYTDSNGFAQIYVRTLLNDGLVQVAATADGEAPVTFDVSTAGGSQVAAGRDHNVALRADGTVWVWPSTVGEAPAQVGQLANVAMVAAGYGFSVALKEDGTVWCWGSNSCGQLGNGSTTDSATPVQATGLTGIVAVAAGDCFSVALRSDGTVWAWGYNGDGELGNNGTTDSSVPVQVRGIVNATEIVAGGYHSVALASDGGVWAWGGNAHGQLGVDSTSLTLEPVQLNSLANVVALAAGTAHSLALTSEGNVYAWGWDGNGQLGNGTTTDSWVPAQVGNLPPCTTITAGGSDSLALAGDGTLFAWGSNINGELGGGATGDSAVPAPVQVGGMSTVVSISGGGTHEVAVTSDGNIWAWGDNTLGQLGAPGAGSLTPVPMDGLSNITAVASASRHALALTSDGNLWTWGYNKTPPNGGLGIGYDSTRQRSVPTVVSGITSVPMALAAGDAHFLIAGADGCVWAWGSNGNGQLGNGTTTDSVSPVEIRAFATAVSVAAGSSHSLALTSDGNVWSWGGNSLGQLGNGTTLDNSSPAQITGISDVVAVAARGSSSFALTRDGSVWAWGADSSAELASSNTGYCSLPVQIPGLPYIVSIAAGPEYCVALASNGTAWAWGVNSAGQLGNGSLENNFTPVQLTGLPGVTAIGAGELDSFAVTSDKSLWGTGENIYGQLGNNLTTPSLAPIQLTAYAGITGVAVGSSSTLVLREDGSVETTGDSAWGQLGVGLAATQPIPNLVLGINLLHIAPQIAFLSPTSGVPISATIGQYQTFEVAVTPGDSAVTNLQLWHHGVKIQDLAYSGANSLSWSPPTWGDFRLTVVAVDQNGAASAQSAPVVVHVPYESSGNGLPDWWQWEYLGIIGVNPDGSSSGDGVSYLQDYQTGRDPNLYLNQTSVTLQKMGGDEQNGTPGSVLAQGLQVQVLGSDGQTPLYNAPVTFSTSFGSGGGLLASASGTATAQRTLIAYTDPTTGIATVYYQSSTAQGDATITATAGSSASVVFTEFDIAGTGTLSVENGDQQSGAPGTTAPQPLVVQLGIPGASITNAPVTFTVAPGGGGFVTDPNDSSQQVQSSIQVNTDSQDGCAQVYFVQPASLGTTSTVTVTAPAAENSVVLTEYTFRALSPLGHWQLNEGSGNVAHDSSGNGNDATLINPVWTTDTAEGSGALQFNGGAGVQSLAVANSTEQVLPLSDNQTFSIAFWIKPAPVPAGAAFSIMNNETAGASGFRCAIDNGYWAPANDGYNLLRFWSTDDDGQVELDAYLPESAVDGNTWHHVVVAYNGTYGSAMFVDGVEAATSQGVIHVNENPLNVGGQIASIALSPDFCGILDDLIIYPYALASDNVDTNLDAMADWWEMEYFGTLNVDPTGDPDQNGLTNLQKYQLGVDPTDPLQGAQGSLVVTGGSQVIYAGLLYPQPITIHVASATGVAVVNAAVTVTLGNSGATLLTAANSSAVATGSTFMTDQNGNIQLWVLAPPSVSQNVPISIQAGSGAYEISSSLDLKTQTVPPPHAPTIVSAEYGSTADILTWSDSYGDQDGFNIERQDIDGIWYSVDHVSATTTSYTVSDAYLYQEANYRVAATLLNLQTPSAETNPLPTTYAAVAVAVPTGSAEVVRLTNSGKLLLQDGENNYYRWQNGKLDLLGQYNQYGATYILEVDDMNEAGQVVGNMIRPPISTGIAASPLGFPITTITSESGLEWASQPVLWNPDTTTFRYIATPRFQYNIEAIAPGTPGTSDVPPLPGTAIPESGGSGLFGNASYRYIDDNGTMYGTAICGYEQGDLGATYNYTPPFISAIPWKDITDGFSSSTGELGTLGFGPIPSGQYLGPITGTGVRVMGVRNGVLWTEVGSALQPQFVGGAPLAHELGLFLTNSGDLLETDGTSYYWQGDQSGTFVLPPQLIGSDNPPWQINLANSRKSGAGYAPQYLGVASNATGVGENVLWEPGAFSNRPRVHSISYLLQESSNPTVFDGAPQLNDFGWLASATQDGFTLLIPVNLTLTQSEISPTVTEIQAALTTNNGSGTVGIEDGSGVTWSLVTKPGAMPAGVLSASTTITSGGTSVITVTHAAGVPVTVSAALSYLVTPQLASNVQGPAATTKIEGQSLQIADLDDVAGPAYRRVALNGRAIAEPISGQKLETESEGEEIYIDALSLRPQHSVTDLYVPIQNSELSLSVRRNLDSEVWNERTGLRPSERPDRPFGAEWSSNLTPNIHLVYQQPNDTDMNVEADYAYVTDEEGNQLRFIILAGQKGQPGPGEYFIPFPSSKMEQAVYLSTLTNNGNGTFTLTKERGTVLQFSLVPGLDTTVGMDRLNPGTHGQVLHRFAAIGTVRDRLGYSLSYQQSSGLTPRSITASTGQVITFTTDPTTGKIASATDPNGKIVTYQYSQVADVDTMGDEGVELTSVTRPADAQGNSPVQQYGYQVVVEPDSRMVTGTPTPWYHIDLNLLMDPLQNSYNLTYTFDHSRQQYDTDNGYYATNGLPRNVASVTLPGNIGTPVQFQNHSHFRASYLGVQAPNVKFDGYRSTYIIDAAGHSRLYQFLNSQVILLNNFRPYANNAVNPINLPRQVLYGTMQVTHYSDHTLNIAEDQANYAVSYSGGASLGTETIRFDEGAGMAVSAYTDINGNQTSYTHGDAWNVAAAYPWLNTYYPYGRYPEPTASVNALGGAEAFSYNTNTSNPNWRLMTSVTDELGRVTNYTLGPQGQKTEEKTRDQTGALIRDMTWKYSNATFLGFVTKHTVLNLDGNTLPWETDLVTSFTPDGAGRTGSQIVSPGSLNLETDYSYDANSNKVAVTDPRHYTTSFAYDGMNRLLSVTYPLITGEGAAASRSYQYDLNGNKIVEMDENGHSTLFAYDAMNRLTTQARDMNGNGQIDPGVDLVTSFAYNPVNSRLSVSDPNGNITSTAYDGFERPSSVTQPMGYVTIFGYGANAGPGPLDALGFKPTSATDARGYITNVTYDGLYRATRRSIGYDLSDLSKQSATSTVYDAVGNAISQTDPRGNVTGMTYDGLNRLTLTTFADATRLQSVYSATGLKAAVIDENLNETDYSYDSGARQITVTGPPVDDGTGTNTVSRPATTMTYDNDGNIATVTDPRGNTTTYRYDERNRKIAEIRPSVFDPATGNQKAPTLTISHDDVGNVVGTTDARLNLTTTTYDAANQPTQITYPAVLLYGGATPVQTNRQTTYDLNGNALTVTDPNGHVTTNQYDPLNRLSTTTDAASIVVSYGYDAADNRTSVKDGRQQTTVFGYDGLNRNTSVTDAAGNVTAYTYDGLLKTERLDALQQRTNYAYDARNRVSAVTYALRPMDNRGYSYDAVGNLLAVAEPGQGGVADVAYSYDALNREVSEMSQGVLHLYAHDLAGNRTRIVYGNTNRLLVSAYDNDNRLSALTDGASVTSYIYDLDGNTVTETLPNGDVATTAFDALNRRQSIDTVSGQNALLQDYAYGYDAKGNVRSISESYADAALNRTVTNTYDNIDRLTQEAVAGAGACSTAYVYDAGNNRISKTVTGGSNAGATTYNFGNNSLNQLGSYTDPSGTTVSFTYDANGNRRASRAGSTMYSYDNENRLIGLTQNGTTYSYTYDYRTRRVGRVEGGAATQIVFSGGTSVQEYANSALTVEYLRGSDWGGGVGGLLYSLRPNGSGQSTPSFTHYDGRGDVTEKTDAGGNVTYQAAYEAFGTRPEETGTTADRQKANTKDEDSTGLLNEGMRYRDLATGVFITRDPAGFVDGPNLYTYVRQNPWSSFDPEGLASLKWWEKIGAKLDKSAGVFVMEDGERIGIRNWRFRSEKVSLNRLAEETDVSAARINRLSDKYGKDLAITYDEAAQPKFTRFAKARIRIEGLTGEHTEDSALAWKQLAKKISPSRLAELEQENLVWHHAGSGYAELIDADLNTAFGHTGEASLFRSARRTAAAAGALATAFLAENTANAMQEKKGVGKALLHDIVDDIQPEVDLVTTVGNKVMNAGEKLMHYWQQNKVHNWLSRKKREDEVSESWKTGAHGD